MNATEGSEPVVLPPEYVNGISLPPGALDALTDQQLGARGGAVLARSQTATGSHMHAYSKQSTALAALAYVPRPHVRTPPTDPLLQCAAGPLASSRGSMLLPPRPYVPQLHLSVCLNCTSPLPNIVQPTWRPRSSFQMRSMRWRRPST